MRTEGALPRRRPRRRALRELLHQGRPTRAAGGRVDPPHRPQAARRRAQRVAVADALRRRGARPAGPSRRPSRPRSSRRPTAPTSRSTAPRWSRARATGSLSAPALEASWDLDVHRRGRGRSPTSPTERLYDAPLPKTKFLSPYPSAHFDGTRDGRRRDDRARGLARDDRAQLGRRARRALGVDPGRASSPASRRAASTWRSGGSRSARGRRRGSATGVLRLDGAEHRLGGFDKLLACKVDDEPTSCDFEIAGDGVKVRGRVSSEPRNFVAWVYADPKGPEHNTLNCSISDLEPGGDAQGRRAAERLARRRRCRLRDRDARHRPRHPACSPIPTARAGGPAGRGA